MKILLSAYACKPDSGSESGIGWGWVQQLSSNGHEVWVLTQKRNQRTIEKKLAVVPLERVQFIYYDLPRIVQWGFLSKLWLFRIWPFTFGKYLLWQIWQYPYHFFWQYFSFRAVKPICRAKIFDVVHHVTFASLTRSSFMGELGIPFYFGPVGGGERAPFRIRKFMRPRYWLYELARDIPIYLIRINPFIRRTFSKATVIYATTFQSKQVIPKRFQHKVVIKSQLGIDERTLHASGRKHRSNDKTIRFLYVGRFIYWKGLELGLKAFGKLCKETSRVELTLIGSGPEEAVLRSVAAQIGARNNIRWHSWVEQSKLSPIYLDHDVFLFPSLHDSGGLVVIEAMAAYLPIICLDLGGPATTVNNSCGIIVDSARKDPGDVIDSLYWAMREFVVDAEKRDCLSLGAHKRAKEYLWPAVVSAIDYVSPHNIGE